MSPRPNLIDWITQKWVQLTGRAVDLTTEPWLDGPIASASGIGPDFPAELATRDGLDVRPAEPTGGLVATFAALRGPTFDPAAVDPRVAQFYEQTAGYELDAWAAWTGIFKPFGWLLAVLFSRRLQQLNVPLSSLDTSQGMTNEVLRFTDRGTGALRYTLWRRRLVATGNILYAAFYSIVKVPGSAGPCMKVVFPLPHGNAVVLMRTEARADGSLVVTSAGERFGDPGFYFTVHGRAGQVRARYVKALRESIRVYATDVRDLRADHVLTLFGATFLRLHYRMRRTAAPT